MNLPDSICMLPWTSLEATPQGTSRPCCLFDEEIVDKEGNKFWLKDASLQEIYKSEYLQNLRQDFLNGGKPKACFRCWDAEAAGATSKRMHTRTRLKELYANVDWSNLQPDQLWFLDLKLGNICNLKCRICGSWSSSKWAEEEIKYVKGLKNPKEHLAYTFLQQGMWPRKSDLFWQNLKKLLPQIKYFEFTGGEPWLIQEHWDLLKYAADNGYSKNIDIHYNTNATQELGPHTQIWSEFGRVDIAFSVDNVGERFEYERYGAEWTKANKIIDDVHFARSADTPNITTQLCFTVNIQNVYYLDELLDWADTKPFDTIYFNLLTSPSHMSIQYMTPESKELVLNKLKSMFWGRDFYQREIDNVIRFIENGPGSDGTEFVRKMTKTDQYRKQDFRLLYPEMAATMGYD